VISRNPDHIDEERSRPVKAFLLSPTVANQHLHRENQLVHKEMRKQSQRFRLDIEINQIELRQK
jgi:hypothetical protein